ncbi:MAG: cytochrome c oxidase subunit II [Chloroflexota bacterium]
MKSFDPVTPPGLSISTLFVLDLVVSGLLMALVTMWLGVALVRFRARPGQTDEPPQVHGNRNLELIWTITPALVLGVVFVLVIQTMRSVDALASGAQPVRVIGHQWWWEYDYPDAQVIAANELHVPVGAPLQISLESVDVIHSFHVPQFGWMQDTVPGKANQMSVLVNRPGVYDGACNQYCGLQHAWMRIRVVAEPVDQFNAWLQQQSRPITPAGTRGEQVFVQNTCVACHSIRGLQATAHVGPDLTHLGSRTTLGTGVVDNTAAYLQQWIRDPQSLKPGVLMPAYQNLSSTDMTALVDYLESLK